MYCDGSTTITLTLSSMIPHFLAGDYKNSFGNQCPTCT